MNKISYAGTADKITTKSKNYEIIIFPDGGALYSDSAETPVKKGQFAIIPPLTVYSPRSDGQIKKIIIEKAVMSLKTVTVMDDAFGEISFFADCAIRRFYNNGDNDGMFKALGALICAYVTENRLLPSLSPVTKAVKENIDSNLSNCAYSLDGFIKKLPLNYDYVRKLFKKETGLTPHEYLISSRMELAANILSGGLSNKYSNYTVAQVAETCGFAEPLYFSRVFKKYFSIAPSSYAKSLNLS